MSKYYIIEDPSLKKLIPPLSGDEFKQLEENILKDGIRDPLTVWYRPAPINGYILIDGHNRHAIAEKHGLDYEINEIEFKNQDEAEKWMILNQFGRRNISAYDRSVLALKLKPIIQEEQKQKQIEGGKSKVQQKSVEATTTQKELGKLAGVSHDTIHKVETIEKEAPEEAERIRSGETTINRVYNSLKPKADKKSIIKQAEEEHNSFSENKSNSIVSIQEIKEDKENLDILSSHYAAEIISAINKIERADFKVQNTKQLIEAMDKNTLQTLRNNIIRAEVIFSRLISFIERVNK